MWGVSGGCWLVECCVRHRVLIALSSESAARDDSKLRGSQIFTLCSAAACLSNEYGEAWCRDASMRLVQSRGGKHRPAAEAFSGATTSIMIDRITGTS